LESAVANPELQTLRHEVGDLESDVAEKEEMLALSQKKQRLKRNEIVLSGEAELQRAVSDICPDIRMMWNSKEAYVEVMVRMYRNPLCRGIFQNGTPYWTYDSSEYRLRLVLEQIFNCTGPAYKTKRLSSKTILTDSIIEFVDYHATHPLCLEDCMPGVPSIGGSWECPQHHNWFRSLP
jgi:hypothetical protein